MGISLVHNFTCEVLMYSPICVALFLNHIFAHAVISVRWFQSSYYKILVLKHLNNDWVVSALLCYFPEPSGPGVSLGNYILAVIAITKEMALAGA